MSSSLSFPPPPPTSTPFPYTTLFRSLVQRSGQERCARPRPRRERDGDEDSACNIDNDEQARERTDRKSTRLNSSHLGISYAVFCLKKKNKKVKTNTMHERLSIISMAR